MTNQRAASERLFDVLDEILQQYFGPGVLSCPRMRRADVEKLLVDDARRRLAETRLAAAAWGQTETVGHVEIASERLLITQHGLLYAVRMNANARPLYFLATPPALFESIVDRVAAASLPPESAAAVDDRFGHDLTFPWPLDTALRRMLDAHPVHFIHV